MSKIRVLLVDDNPAILEALAGMLRPNFAVVGLISRGAEVVDQAEALKPDVIVLDISLGDVNGFEVATAFKIARCPARILFLSVHEDPEFVRRAFEVGGSGYVFKSKMPDLPRAIEEVAHGRIYSSVIFTVRR